LPQVTSPQALVPAHVISQSAVPHVMLLQALVPVQWIVHDAASVQLMLSHALSLHVMSQWWPCGHVTRSPFAPLTVQVGGFTVRSQPPLQSLGHALSSTTQYPPSQTRGAAQSACVEHFSASDRLLTRQPTPTADDRRSARTLGLMDTTDTA